MAKGGGRNRPNAAIGFSFAEDPDLDPKKIGEKEVKCVYRINMPSHTYPQSGCRKNCKFNPRCFVGLGEKFWLEAEEEDEEDTDTEIDDDMTRVDGVPAGLRNLGNTCYVNSFLQIWFHNLKFRKSLYDWEPGEDPEERDNESILEAELYEPRSKVASLQALFAMMQFTKRKYVDPQDFICKLGLNPSIQQDAQEFSKLFISLLEDSLAHQKQDSVRTMIQKQFRGEYAYVTTCQKCMNESIRPSHFYELDLPLAGNKTIGECLQDFLKIEKMTGDEKYYCEKCCSKQDATRCCKLRELPPILNLQLNRFQFDMQLGRKKKLNSAIQFPEELDMVEYLGPEAKNSKYSLTGVLMHLGPDANHGHYIANIQDMETGNWFRFSDETVNVLQGKMLKLGLDDEFAGPGQKKQGASKVIKGSAKPGDKVQTSNNAYMLVYMEKQTLLDIRSNEIRERTKKDLIRTAAFKKQNISSSEYCLSNGKIFPVNFPPHLKTKIDKDNLEFEEERDERLTSREHERIETRLKQQRMVERYRSLHFDEAMGPNSFEFLPLSWITKWMMNPNTCGPIDTRPLLCQHDRLDIDKLSDVKICDADTVSQLLEEHGGEGERLDRSKLCEMCVANRARMISLEARMIRDHTFLVSQKSPSDGTGFWVGKKSFNRWRALGKLALENKIVQEVVEWKSEEKTNNWKIESNNRKRKLEKDSEDKLCLEDLKAKLARMGTNVSLANVDSKSDASKVAGVSVIKSEENSKVSSLMSSGDVKTFSEDEKKVKPSCAVKPIVKGPKPSATVKPFVKSEGITEFDKGESLKVNGDPAHDLASAQSVSAPVSGSASNCCSESRSSSRSSSLDSDPSTEDVSASSELTSSREASGGDDSSDSASPTPPYKVPGEDDFNGDIVCPHGNLRIEQKYRQLISREAWYRLNSYFSKPITFQFGTPNCSTCEEDHNEANLLKEKWREVAARQKARLTDLFKDVERPKWSRPSTTRVYLLNSHFVMAWRGFVRGLSAGKADAVGEGITDVKNKILLCDHDGFTFLPTIAWETEPHPALVMVSEDEWAAVCDMFCVDVEICVDRENTMNGPVLTVSPAPCHICVASRQEAEREDRLRYNNAPLFVRRILPESGFQNQSSNDPEFGDGPGTISLYCISLS